MAASPEKLEVVRTRPRLLHDDAPADANGNGLPKATPMIAGKAVDPEEIAAEVEAMGAEEAIAWAIETFDPLRFAVSFQKTSSVIVNMAHGIDPGVDFFYLDTELLFPETYQTRDRLAEHFGIEFNRYAGITLEEQREQHGDILWLHDQDACCGIRKVEAMRDALDGVQCWVSGIRREDSVTRGGAAKFGWDARFGLWKLNPLADWDEKQVWTYIKDKHVPYNPLHDQGYPSIGCIPCTSKPLAGGDARSGRWAGSERTECGING
jgi:phosphoadenosine phosphosulfate reductase